MRWRVPKLNRPAQFYMVRTKLSKNRMHKLEVSGDTAILLPVSAQDGQWVKICCQGAVETAADRCRGSNTGRYCEVGIRKWKVAPWPTIDSSQMRPPGCSTIRLHKARPMPGPGNSRLVCTPWKTRKRRSQGS